MTITREDMIGSFWMAADRFGVETMMVIEFDDNDCPVLLVRREDGRIEISRTTVNFSHWCQIDRTFPWRMI